MVLLYTQTTNKHTHTHNSYTTTQLSAAVAMELLYYYALAHQNSFDVRWIKKRTIAESIINPLAVSLEDKFPLELKAKRLVICVCVCVCACVRARDVSFVFCFST